MSSKAVTREATGNETKLKEIRMKGETVSKQGTNDKPRLLLKRSARIRTGI